MKTAVKTPVIKPTMKKKKSPDLNEDSVSETISFVIKGKLTPIKPDLTPISNTTLDKKLSGHRKSLSRIVKKKIVRKPKADLKEKVLKISNACRYNSKVQIKTAKKSSALKPSKKKLPDPISSQLTSSISKITLAPHLTTCLQKKDVIQKKNPVKKLAEPAIKIGKIGNLKIITKTSTKPKKCVKEPIEIKCVKEPIEIKYAKELTDIKNECSKKKIKKELLPTNKVKAVKKNTVAKEVETANTDAETKKYEDLKTKETIEKLLKQANKALKTPSSVCAKGKKVNKEKPKKISEDKVVKKIKKPFQRKSELNTSNLNVARRLQTQSALKGKCNEKPDLDAVKSEDTPAPLKSPKVQTKPKSRILVKSTGNKTTVKTNKFKAKVKGILVKKRLKAKEEKFKKQLADVNTPKCQRVASLNALAKVHCLYENETRGNMFDSMEADLLQRESDFGREGKKTPKVEEVEVSTRTLRCVPGLRAVGKHWDMTDTTSSSEDNSGYETDVKPYKPKIKKEVVQSEDMEEKPKEVKKTVRKRRRNQTELFMDLKDMVVRKRMASLNATAILAASYSTERRSIKSPDSENSYGDTDTESEEECISTDEEILKKKCFEDDIKKEDKLIEVHTTPNKKVAVILNQDTDVTITGVYVNSTTRSTHHEGYCSIAGMQYRISATSHTQTAATAVATETLLQSSSTSAPENSNSESLPSTKSYTPLDALSNMQPPPGPGIQHNHPHPVIHGPPPHVLPLPTAHQVSPTVRHGCTSAFSSPHASSASGYPPPSMAHHPEDSGYIHGYYQPAGPLITVPHAHGQPPQPPPPPITKSAPLSEASPTSTSPPPPTHLPPPPPSSNGDSSDSEVIITSVTTAKEAMPQHPQTYRFQQYPSTPPGYAYSYTPYPYPTPPPPTPPYPHHELCYPPNPYIHHKYPPPPATYRRYLPSTSYYPPNPPDVYPPPPTGSSAQPTQQVVTATPVSAGTSFQTVPSGAPPTLMETYSGPPPPTLVETYQPPPHYYPSAYGPPPPPPSCYTHSPSRTIPYLNATYQSCPCPMQSCPKNVLTGPLTGDSKRSNISSIAKDSMPLPPVALALPLEPASATGPPSPARGSAGMPPPPSPAGATYQTPPAPKEESHPIETEECKNPEKKRKARIGKAMVRNDIRQNTMLLMLNPQNLVNNVKREIESPQEKVDDEQKSQCVREEETILPVVSKAESDVNDNHMLVPDLKEEKESERTPSPQEVNSEPLPPCILTVAENVKVKNMKRKLSLSSENVPEVKKSKNEIVLGSYKNLIKKDKAPIKITNGKRKLLTSNVRRRILKSNLKVRKTILKKPVRRNPKVTAGIKAKVKTETVGEATSSQVKETKKKQKKNPVNSKLNSKSDGTLCDNVSTKNSVDEVIESVVCESVMRTSKKTSALKTNSKVLKTNKESVQNKKSTNPKKCKTHSQTKHEDQNDQVKIEKPNNINNNKMKNENKKVVVAKKKTKCKEVIPEMVPKIPRRSLGHPKWSNGWKWEGKSYEAKVFLNSDEITITRICYPAMRHISGDILEPRDCVLLKAGPRKNDLPFVAKIAALWENPEDGEMMMSLLWYYRPEHTEQGRLPNDCPDEVFASRHKDSNSVACIDDKCYVLTFNEYCRYRKNFRRLEEGLAEQSSCIPSLDAYPRMNRQPPDPLRISPEMVFFCRRVYDFRQKRIIKNPA